MGRGPIWGRNHKGADLTSMTGSSDPILFIDAPGLSPLAPGNHARRRAGAYPHGMAVIAADRQDGSAAQDLDHLENVVWHYPDDTWRRPIRRPAPMRPIASEIVFRSGIAADQMAH